MCHSSGIIISMLKLHISISYIESRISSINDQLSSHKWPLAMEGISSLIYAHT